jgi:hypothetical protein
MRQEVFCRDCRTNLIETEKTCPNCGSENRIIVLPLKEALEIHGQMKGTVIEKRGKSRRATEFKVGDDFDRNGNKWVHLERIIDRNKDLYVEIITDPETGNTIKKNQEPLSKHRGHGDAKSVRSVKPKTNI